ncbi:MAG: hypothetical protein VKS61_02765 [Candidatus Sericytochromatia bacterium]|nr:hypothetical protein [Candidatus Sericytochromatia bacterium]
MEDGRKPPDDKPRPTWTSRADGDRPLRPGPPTQRLNPDELDALVPAADGIVTSAYGRTGALPSRPLMHRGDGHTDALVIQRATREARVLNFTVDNIQWRAGFAPQLAQTPVGRHVKVLDPLPGATSDPTGFELRPGDVTHDRVLRDIIPRPLLQQEELMFGSGQEAVAFYLYYIPSGKTAVAGACVIYGASALGKGHALYLQTEVKRADPRILDEMARTFAASSVAMAHQAPDARAFDFWRELQEARADVRQTLQDSSLGRNAGAVRERVAQARESAEYRAYNALMRTFDRLGSWGYTLAVALPQRVLAGVVKGASGAFVAAVRGLDRGVSRLAPPRDGEPPDG